MNRAKAELNFENNKVSFNIVLEFGERKFKRRTTALVFSAAQFAQKLGLTIGAFVAFTADHAVPGRTETEWRAFQGHCSTFNTTA